MFFAYFLLVVVSYQEWPVMLGPYTLDDCLSVKEYMDRRGYEVSSCEWLSIPQEAAVSLQIPYLP